MSKQEDKLSACVCGMSRLTLNSNDKQDLIIRSKTASKKDKENKKHLTVLMNFIKDLNSLGIFVKDEFLGNELGSSVFDEVVMLHAAGVFTKGQLVRNNTSNNAIRGDQITWVAGNEPSCKNIGRLITEIDKVVLTGNKMQGNGELGKYKIDGRTKAMVACYPGGGTQYVKHVDNPNKDGRCITAIYYLNKDWNTENDGGVLRIFPIGQKERVAQIEPKFDRLLFFWSDRRNPHEVLPSFRTRYAITIWYLDATERSESPTLAHSQTQSTTK